MDIPEINPNLPGAWEWPDSVRQRNVHEHATPSEPEAAQTQVKSEHAPKPTPTTPTPAPSQSRSQSHSQSQSQSQSHNAKRPRTWKARTCRICLETVHPTVSTPMEHVPGILQPPPRVTYESEMGRLLSPCKCKGSAKYVHEQCLQEWRHMDRAYGRRNYYDCPTCGFSYRISRIGVASFISSVAAQIALTLTIFLFTIFILGFVSDFVIDLCLDPWGSIWRGFGLRGRTTYYYDDLEETAGWFEHFSKGFASLGLLSFFKAMLASPIQIWRTSYGGRNRNTGRERLGGVTWIVIMIGAATFAFTVWKAVRLWTRRTLERAGERVMDVQGDDDDDDDDET